MVPHTHGRAQTPTLLRMQHSPSQSDSSAMSSRRGRAGVVGQADPDLEAHTGAGIRIPVTRRTIRLVRLAFYVFSLFPSLRYRSFLPLLPPPFFRRSSPLAPPFSSLVFSFLSSQSNANTHPSYPSSSTCTSNKKKWWLLPSIGGMGIGGTEG